MYLKKPPLFLEHFSWCLHADYGLSQRDLSKDAYVIRPYYLLCSVRIRPNVFAQYTNVSTAQPCWSLELRFSPHLSCVCNSYPNPKCLALLYLWVFLPVFLLRNLYFQSLLNFHSLFRSQLLWEAPDTVSLS